MLDTKNPIYRITVMGEEIPIVPSDFVIPEPTPPTPEEPDTDYDQNYRTVIHSLSTPVPENGWVSSAAVVEAISAVFDENLFQSNYSGGTNPINSILEQWQNSDKNTFESLGFVLETFRHQTNVTLEDGTTRLVNIYDEKDLTTPLTVRNVGYVLNGQIVDYETLYNRSDWVMFLYTTVVIKNTGNTVDIYLYIYALESGVYTSADGLITLNLDNDTNTSSTNFSNMNEYAGQVFSLSLYPGMNYDPETGEEYLGASAYVYDNNLGSLEFKFTFTGFNQLSYKGTPLTKTGDIQVATPVSFSWDIDSSKFASYRVIDPQTGIEVSSVTPGKTYNVYFSTHAGFYAESLTIDAVQQAFWDAGGIASTTVSFTAPSNAFTIGLHLVATPVTIPINVDNPSNLTSYYIQDMSGNQVTELYIGQQYTIVAEPLAPACYIRDITLNGSMSGQALYLYTPSSGVTIDRRTFTLPDLGMPMTIDIETSNGYKEVTITSSYTVEGNDTFNTMLSFPSAELLYSHGEAIPLNNYTDSSSYNEYNNKTRHQRVYTVSLMEAGTFVLRATPKNVDTHKIIVSGITSSPFIGSRSNGDSLGGIQEYTFSFDPARLHSSANIYLSESEITETPLTYDTLADIASGAGINIQVYDSQGNYVGDTRSAKLLHNNLYTVKPELSCEYPLTVPELRLGDTVIAQPFSDAPEVTFTYKYGETLIIVYAGIGRIYPITITGNNSESANVRITLLDGTPVALTDIRKNTHYMLHVSASGQYNKVSRILLGSRELYVDSGTPNSDVSIGNPILFGEKYYDDTSSSHVDYIDDTLTIDLEYDSNAPINYSTEYDTNAINSVDILALDGNMPAQYFPNSTYQVVPHANDGFVVTSIQVDGTEIYHYDQASGTTTGEATFTPTIHFAVTVVAEAVSTTTTYTPQVTTSNCNYIFTDSEGNDVAQFDPETMESTINLTKGETYTLYIIPVPGYGNHVITFNGTTVSSPYTFTVEEQPVINITSEQLGTTEISINFDSGVSSAYLDHMHYTGRPMGASAMSPYYQHTNYFVVANLNEGYEVVSITDNYGNTYSIDSPINTGDHTNIVLTVTTQPTM